MMINEIFYSLQGEGLLAGVPSVFIRLAGCPLRCTWCDTKYALDPSAGEDLDIEQLIERIETVAARPGVESRACPAKPEGRRRATSHKALGGVSFQRDEPQSPWRSLVSARRVTSHGYVVITGGEPMVNSQLGELSAALREIGKHITIETSGIVFANGLSCDLMSISPKTSNSGIKKDADYAPLRELIRRYPCQLKFVVESPDDLLEIQEIIKKIGDIDKNRIMLMPQAKTRDELIAKAPMVADLCKQTGFSFCNRLQILLWNNKRAT